jgi:hypothetical protein
MGLAREGRAVSSMDDMGMMGRGGGGGGKEVIVGDWRRW